MRIRWAVFLGVLLVPAVVLAQTDVCFSNVQAAVEATSATCDVARADEACVGYAPFFAAAQATYSVALNEPGDVDAVRALDALRVGPRDGDTFGMALVEVQANLDPGDSASVLLFGNAAVRNGVEAEPRPPEFQATSTGTLNVRAGPSTSNRVITTLLPDDGVTAVGRLADSSWLLIRLPGEEGTLGWASAEVGVLNVVGLIPELTVVSEDNIEVAVPEEPRFGAMQVFTFLSGADDAGCEGAPESGMLVQSPNNEQVILIINGINVRLSGTAFVQAQPGADMVFNVVAGRARLAFDGSAKTVVAGSRLRMAINDDLAVSGELIRPEAYDVTDVANLPIGALRETVTVAGPLPEDKLVPGGGDVQVTLTWDNDADLDLTVIEPGGDAIYYAVPSSPSGGQLDVDSNAPCNENPGSVENVFWSDGSAPEGTYEVYVQQHDTCDDGDANWMLTVQVDGEEVLVQRGTGGRGVFSFFR